VVRSTSIIDIIHSGECFAFRESLKMPVAGTCKRCGYISSQQLCKACVMLEGLNKGLARISLGKETRAAKAFESAVLKSAALAPTEEPAVPLPAPVPVASTRKEEVSGTTIPTTDTGL